MTNTAETATNAEIEDISIDLSISTAPTMTAQKMLELLLTLTAAEQRWVVEEWLQALEDLPEGEAPSLDEAINILSTADGGVLPTEAEATANSTAIGQWIDEFLSSPSDKADEWWDSFEEALERHNHGFEFDQKKEA
ncbi:MAG: hypothetical protein AAF639_21855 [Chloroflexota bacterium]